MVKKRSQKKGISPVIATVLLVAMVVVLALIIFLWFRGLTKEAITKFGGENIDNVCGEVSFSSDYSSGTLSVTNNGNVPIYSLDIKVVSQGSHTTQDIRDISGTWPDVGLNQGGIYSSEDLSSDFSGATQIVVIPILVGTSDKGERTHTCAEAQGTTLNL